MAKRAEADFRLNPSEDLKHCLHTYYDGKAGFFFITTRRVAWQKAGDLAPKFSLPLRDIKKTLKTTSAGNVTIQVYAHDVGADGIGQYKIRFQRGGDTERSTVTYDQAVANLNTALASIGALQKEAKKRTDEEDILDAAWAEDKKKKSFKNVRRDEIASKREKSRLLKEKKAKFLMQNPLLKKLFIEGVKEKRIIPEKLFWESFQQELKRPSTTSSLEKRQARGVSSGLFGNISKSHSSDGQHYEIELTTEIVEGIFKLYPTLRASYQKLVIEKKEMPESLFWKNVWLSPLFQRGTQTKATAKNQDNFAFIFGNHDDDEDDDDAGVLDEGADREEAARDSSRNERRGGDKDDDDDDDEEDEDAVYVVEDDDDDGNDGMGEGEGNPQKRSKKSKKKGRRKIRAPQGGDANDLQLANPLNDIGSEDVLHDVELASGHKSLTELKSSTQQNIRRRRRHISMLNNESATILDLMADKPQLLNNIARAEKIQEILRESTQLEDLMPEKSEHYIPLKSIEEVYKAASLNAQATARQGGDDGLQRPRRLRNGDAGHTMTTLRPVPIHAQPTLCESALQAITDNLEQVGNVAKADQLGKELLLEFVQYEEVFGALLKVFWKTRCDYRRYRRKDDRQRLKKLKKQLSSYKVKLDNYMETLSAAQRPSMFILGNRVDKALLEAHSVVPQ